MDLNNLAILYDTQKNYAEAEPLYQRAFSIWETSLGPDHPYIAANLESYAALLKMTNRENEAEKMLARAREIRVKHASRDTAIQ